MKHVTHILFHLTRPLVFIAILSVAGCAAPKTLPEHIRKSIKRQHSYDQGFKAQRRQKAHEEWMRSAPDVEVEARTKRGNYSFLGVANYGAEEFWIPGIMAKTNHPSRHDVEYYGIGILESTEGAAEKYMRQFNMLMEEAREGILLDIYGHSAVRSQKLSRQEQTENIDNSHSPDTDEQDESR